jgi:hypothetical protein
MSLYKGRHRKYILLEDYFSSIIDENRAYWLGFLIADGYNSGKLIRVDIQDYGHLEKFRDEIYPNRDMPIRIKINPINGKKIYYIVIQNPIFVKNCNSFGVVRKSLIVEYPDIPENFDRHFIRGIFDGDGCLTYHMSGNYRRYTFSIVGSMNLMMSIKSKIEKIGIYVGFRKTKSIYEIHVRGNRQIISLLNYLYDDSVISLDRKFLKYDDMIKWDGYKRDKKINNILNMEASKQEDKGYRM